MQTFEREAAHRADEVTRSAEYADLCECQDAMARAFAAKNRARMEALSIRKRRILERIWATKGWPLEELDKTVETWTLLNAKGV